MWIGVGELAEVVVFRLLQGRRQALHRWSRQRHLLHQLQLQLRFLLQLQQRSRQHQPQELQREYSTWKDGGGRGEEGGTEGGGCWNGVVAVGFGSEAT